MNKASLDRGFGRTLVFKKYETELVKYKGGLSDVRTKPPT